jgi:TPR repeat protein
MPYSASQHVKVILLGGLFGFSPELPWPREPSPSHAAAYVPQPAVSGPSRRAEEANRTCPAVGAVIMGSDLARQVRSYKLRLIWLATREALSPEQKDRALRELLPAVTDLAVLKPILCQMNEDGVLTDAEYRTLVEQLIEVVTAERNRPATARRAESEEEADQDPDEDRSSQSSQGRPRARSPVAPHPSAAACDDGRRYSPAEMYEQGRNYALARGVAQDFSKAACWYRRSAEGGYARAMTSLGYLYERGLGVSRDYVEARRWYQRGADAGETLSMNNLGHMWYKGYGGPQDHHQAVEWYRRGANSGSTIAMVNLGYMYATGQGVTRNDREAVRLYRMAADKRSARGWRRLGDMVLAGRGVVGIDSIEAIRCYRESAAAGDTLAGRRLGRVLQRIGSAGRGDSVLVSALRGDCDVGRVNSRTDGDGR